MSRDATKILVIFQNVKLQNLRPFALKGKDLSLLILLELNRARLRVTLILK